MAKKSTASWCEAGHANPRLIGWSRDPETGQWVCGHCRKPSKTVYELENNNG